MKKNNFCESYNRMMADNRRYEREAMKGIGVVLAIIFVVATVVIHFS